MFFTVNIHKVHERCTLNLKAHLYFTHIRLILVLFKGAFYSLSMSICFVREDLANG